MLPHPATPRASEVRNRQRGQWKHGESLSGGGKVAFLQNQNERKRKRKERERKIREKEREKEKK